MRTQTTAESQNRRLHNANITNPVSPGMTHIQVDELTYRSVERGHLRFPYNAHIKAR
jgi:hypothetical protein